MYLSFNKMFFALFCCYFVTFLLPVLFFCLSLQAKESKELKKAKQQVTNICNMPVYLRKKEYKARYRYYLDIYQKGQRHYEFLDLYQYKGKNPFDVKSNKEHKELAENIRAKKQIELQSDSYDIEPKHKQQIYFLPYFQQWLKEYPNKDVRLANACYNYFIKFLEFKGLSNKITTKQITKDLAKKFREYLDKNLNGETPHNYFSKFIKLCNDATDARVFKVSPCHKIKNTRPEGLKKDILSMDEIQVLKEANCQNSEVKKAFLLSIYTGLRWIDVKTLKWKNIDKDVIRLFQSKTGREVVIYMNDYAMSLLSERGKRDELVFTLPSHSMALRVIKTLTENAGIDKHITWHSARHSYAVVLLTNKTDIKTVSSLLGHTTLKHTEKYTRVVDELKKQAAKSLK